MRFVVVIPFSLYLLLGLIAFAIGVYAFVFVALVGGIYLFIRYPREMVGFILIGLAFRFWFITLPILAGLFIAGFFSKKKTNDIGAQSSEPIQQIGSDLNASPPAEHL